jgi:hypothetical protein
MRILFRTARSKDTDNTYLGLSCTINHYNCTYERYILKADIRFLFWTLLIHF